MWAWLATADPAIALNSVQSLPRELSLRDDGSLRIEPLHELKSLRYDQTILNNVVLMPPNNVQSGSFHTSKKIAELDGDSFEVRILLDRREVERKRFGVQMFADAGSEGLPILIRPESGTICVGDTEAPFALAELPEGEDVDLRIFVDKYLVEVFVNGRQAALCTFMAYNDGGNEMRGYVFSGRNNQVQSTTIRKVEIWKLRPVNQGFLEAREDRIWAPDID